MQGGQRVRDQLGQHDRPQQDRRAHAPAALWQDTGMAGGRLGPLRLSAWSHVPLAVLSSSGRFGTAKASGRPATSLQPRVLEPTASQSRRCRCLFTAQESLAICEYLCARFPGAAASKLLPPPGRARAEVHQWVSVEATELRPHALKPCEPPPPPPPHPTAPHRTPPHPTPSDPADLRACRPTPRSPRARAAFARRHPAGAQADEGTGRARRGHRRGGPPRRGARTRPLRSLQPCAHTPVTIRLLPTCTCPACNPRRPAILLGATPALDVLDAHLAASGQSYLAGADFTLADLGFVPYLQALCDAGCEDLLEARPFLHAWLGRCRARPTWQAVVAMSAR